MTYKLLGALLMAAAVGAFSEGVTADKKDIQELRARIVQLESVLQNQLEQQKTASTVNPSQQRAGRRLSQQTPGRRLSVEALATCLDYMWLLISGALVMFMQAGFAILEAGSVTQKNSGYVLLKNLVDVCVGTLAWYFLGYGIAYGVEDEDANSFVGRQAFVGGDFLELDDEGGMTGSGHFKDWFFQWAFCATAATIVSGGVAERITFPAYLVYSTLMTAFIYPFIVYWTWSGSGWLTIGSGTAEEADGYSDFAGSGIVHLCGGTGALVGAALLGPRQGRWERPDDFLPCNASMVVLGTFILWFGWYGFNCGSTLAFSDVGTATLGGMVAMNSTLAAAAGGIMVFILRLRLKKFDMCGMCNGILAGLVAICAGVGDMEPFWAMITGMAGGIAQEFGHVVVAALKIDDPLDAFAVHGCGGIMGLLLRPIMSMGGPKGTMFGWHCLGAVVIFAWSGVWTFLIFFIFKLLGQLRVTEEVEEKGEDVQMAHSPPKPYAPDAGQA